MKNNLVKRIVLVMMAMLLACGSLVACGDNSAKNEVQLLSEDEIEGMKFKRGDLFADMSVTTPDGTTYKISELLKEKKAVVLNFWFINCEPCRMEFPYMQAAYEKYQDDIEILAVNPEDGTDKSVSRYQQDNGLTFPMAVTDIKWAQHLSINAYPTTIVIDRYGIISYVHTGMITTEEEFDKLFGFFTADDYEQTVIKNIEDIK